jgi:hypothetical protein
MDTTTIRTLHCYGCGRDLPETAFSHDSYAKRKRSAKCRQCCLEAFPAPLTVDAIPYELHSKYPAEMVRRHQEALRTIVPFLTCGHCGAKGKAVIARKTSASNVYIVRAWCLSCHREGGKDFKHNLLEGRGIVLGLLPEYDKADSHVCAVEGCYRTDTELHHFLPRHINPDLAEMYPQAYLCRSEHHPLWHRLVTPNMSNGNGRKELP